MNRSCNRTGKKDTRKATKAESDALRAMKDPMVSHADPEGFARVPTKPDEIRRAYS